MELTRSMPALAEAFSTERLPIDVSRPHRPDDPQAPDYPMPLIIGVFDFPDRARAGEPEPDPELIVTRVPGR